MEARQKLIVEFVLISFSTKMPMSQYYSPTILLNAAPLVMTSCFQKLRNRKIIRCLILRPADEKHLKPDCFPDGWLRLGMSAIRLHYRAGTMCFSPDSILLGFFGGDVNFLEFKSAFFNTSETTE